MAVSMFLCVISIRDIWIKWNENPVIIAFDDKFTGVSSIPFPSITVCPYTKIHAKHIRFADRVDEIAYMFLLEPRNWTETE